MLRSRATGVPPSECGQGSLGWGRPGSPMGPPGTESVSLIKEASFPESPLRYRWRFSDRQTRFKNILLIFMSKSILLMFSSRSFIVPHFTFRLLTNFEFTVVYGIRECFNFILLHVAVQFSQHHLLKRLSFLHCIFLPPLL